MKNIRLDKVAEVLRGVTFSKAEGSQFSSSDRLPVIRAGSIQESLLLDEGQIWVPAKKVKLHQLIKKNDIIMCTSSGSSNLVGKCAKSTQDWNGSFGAFCAGIRADESKCNSSYLYHFLCSPSFRNWTKSSSGANIKNIRASELAAFKIPLPPLPEQKRIAAILDKADAIRRKRQLAIEKSEEFLRSVFLDMFGDPVTNPKGWEMGTIRDLVSEVKYGTSDKAGEDGQYPILRMNNITYSGNWNFSDLKYINLEKKDEPKYLAQKGDLLFNRTNSKELVGKTAVYREIEPMAIAGYLIRVRANEKGDNEFISGYLNSTYGKIKLKHMCKNIVGMANINAQEFQDIPIFIPSYDKQKQYAHLVNKVVINSKKYKKSLIISNQLFSSLTHLAFRGELTNQAAEELLEAVG